jgi:hypothetical protein
MTPLIEPSIKHLPEQKNSKNGCQHMKNVLLDSMQDYAFEQ